MWMVRVLLLAGMYTNFSFAADPKSRGELVAHLKEQQAVYTELALLCHETGDDETARCLEQKRETLRDSLTHLDRLCRKIRVLELAKTRGPRRLAEIEEVLHCFTQLEKDFRALGFLDSADYVAVLLADQQAKLRRLQSAGDEKRSCRGRRVADDPHEAPKLLRAPVKASDDWLEEYRAAQGAGASKQAKKGRKKARRKK